MAQSAERTTGPMPTGRRVNGLPVPFFFLEESAEAFKQISVADSDVLMVSLPKSGTTWVNRILYLMLHGISDDGTVVDGCTQLGKDLQAYPEGLPLTTPESPHFLWGMASLNDLVNQPARRLFSTHMWGDFLPPAFTDPKSPDGKLIFVIRNIKDMMVSLHYFRGEAKDGWHGNEHGPGSLYRYLHPDTSNAYGSVFSAMEWMDKVVTELESTGRVKVLYYERLKEDLASEIDAIASFLGETLTAAKKEAILSAVSFSSMKGNSSVVSLLRKGQIGDWKNHLDEKSWQKVDDVINDRLVDVDIAKPLANYH